jgi:hypothetical protein
MNPKYYPRFNDPFDSRQSETEVRKALIEIYKDLTSISATSTVTGGGLAPKHGLTLSNSGTTSIGITAGGIPDSTSTVQLIQTSSYIKTFSNWAVGSGQGMLDNGTVAVGWYSVWIISDLVTTDYIASLSSTAPLLPTGYTYKRRIGWVYISAIGPTVARPFINYGPNYYLVTPVQDFNGVTPNTTRNLVTVSCPISTMGAFTVAYNDGTVGNNYLAFGATLQTDAAASASNFSLATQGATSTKDSGQFNTFVDTSNQVYYRALNAGQTVQIITQGWVDYLILT